MHRSSTAIMLAVATGFLTVAASADEARQFDGFRALVVAPGQVWQEWDSAIQVGRVDFTSVTAYVGES